MRSTNSKPGLYCGRVDWLDCHHHETGSTFLFFPIDKRVDVLVCSITSNLRYATIWNQ